MDEKQQDENLFISDEEIESLFEDIIEGPMIAGYCKTNCYAYQCSVSDERLKDILSDNVAGLKEINSLAVKNFVFKNDALRRPRVGVIAQELMQVFPNSVSQDYSGYYTINTDEMFYAMLNAIKELSSQNDELRRRLDALEKNN